MILAIDMGNTNIVIGCIDDKQTYFVERVTTSHDKTGTEYAINIKNILEIHHIEPSQIEGAILSSVVPPLNAIISSAVKKILGYHPMLVGAGIKTGMNILMDNPKTVGSDMIVDAVAAIHVCMLFFQHADKTGDLVSGNSARHANYHSLSLKHDFPPCRLSRHFIEFYIYETVSNKNSLGIF